LREPDPQRLVVAMVGSTGAGESALLNSITDVSRLAKEVCAGESCTIVPTVYTHRLSWQIDEPFTAEILYYPVSRCRELLHEQLRAYRLFHFQKDGVWNADQEKKYARAADTALETFRTLFCDHEQFESPRSAKGSLQSDFLESRNGLLETMVGWFQEHFHGYSTENDASYQQFADNSADGLNRLVDPLTTPNHRMDEPSLWPLVEKVIVGVPSSRVLEYIDIVDLPGKTATSCTWCTLTPHRNNRYQPDTREHRARQHPQMPCALVCDCSRPSMHGSCIGQNAEHVRRALSRRSRHYRHTFGSPGV